MVRRRADLDALARDPTDSGVGHAPHDADMIDADFGDRSTRRPGRPVEPADGAQCHQPDDWRDGGDRRLRGVAAALITSRRTRGSSTWPMCPETRTITALGQLPPTIARAVSGWNATNPAIRMHPEYKSERSVSAAVEPGAHRTTLHSQERDTSIYLRARDYLSRLKIGVCYG